MQRELVWTHDLTGKQTGVVSRGIMSLVTDRTLDGAETLTLTVPATDPKVPLLVEGTELRHRNGRWIVDEIVEERKGAQVVVRVEAVAAWDELSALTIVGDLSISDRSVASGGRLILSGTRWKVGPLTSTAGDHQMQENDISVLAAARRWATITGTMLVFDTAARTVDWVAARGVEVGLAFRYGRNISSLTRRHRAPTITELWPYGASDLTIAGINGGVPYLEDYSWFTDRGVDIATARARQKRRVVWHDTAITSEWDLLAAGQAVLAAASGGSETIEVAVVDVSTITGVAEDLEPGDRVRALDPVIGDEFEATVTRVVRDWLAPSRGTIELSTSPQVVASPASSSRPSTALQWLQFTGRVEGAYLVRNDGTWTLARVPLRFGEVGQGHMAASVQLVGEGDGRARVWIYDASDDEVVREVWVDYADGEVVPVTLTAGIPAAVGRHDYRLRITTEAAGGPDPDAGVNVWPDPEKVAAFWIMAWGAVQESPPPVQSVTFSYTGAVQHWVVPDGVTSVRVVATAGSGGPTAEAGRGGVVSGTVPVTPGNTLDIAVGGSAAGGDNNAGGWPGGGNGAVNGNGSYAHGGGGASWVATSGGTIGTARIVAGGGGGRSDSSDPLARGGNGGLFFGDPGADNGDFEGGGATQFAGGAAGTAVAGGGTATAGTAGQGGNGSSGTAIAYNPGGGGGGGRFGGGGGGSGSTPVPGGGGGGGSGWVDPDVYDVQVSVASSVGHGQVVISWDE